MASGTGNRIRVRADPPAFLGLEERKGGEASEGRRGVRERHQQEMRQEGIETIPKLELRFNGGPKISKNVSNMSQKCVKI